MKNAKIKPITKFYRKNYEINVKKPFFIGEELIDNKSLFFS